MPRTFTNSYSTTQVLSNPTTDNPATVTASGTITVNSTIASAVALYGSAGTSWSITNLGTVESVGTLGVGISLAGSAYRQPNQRIVDLVAGYEPSGSPPLPTPI